MNKNPVFETFKNDFPELGQTFGQLYSQCSLDALDEKTKELVYLGVLTAVRYAPAIPVHLTKALKAGASKDEVMAAMMMAVPAGGICHFLAVFPTAKAILEGWSE